MALKIERQLRHLSVVHFRALSMMFRRRMLALKPAEAVDAQPRQDIPFVVLLDDREATLGASARDSELIKGGKAK